MHTNEEYQLNMDLTEKQGMQVALRAGITPDGKRVVAEWTEFQGYDQNAQKYGKVEAWDTATGNRVWSRPVLQLATDESRFSNIQYHQQPLSFTSDSKSVAVSGGILDVATGQQKGDWGAPLPQIRSGCFDPFGKRLISFDDSKFRYWDVDTGKLLEEWPLPYNSDYRLLSILPDGRTALIAVPPSQWSSDNASIHIQWVELASHQVRARYAFEKQFPFALIGVSPDGNTLVGTNKSNGLAIWKVRTTPKQIRLTSKQALEQHWKKVCEMSAEGGWKAMLALAGDPDQTIPFVMEQLKQRPLSKQKQAIPEVDTSRVRDVRAVELLEMIGHAEAKKMLAQLAGGAS
ncbi:MAG TPA: WD40 repeat domain-containing protein, partial [Gemmatales bacterium]|nr:WD40 repeat domain-containing protein [Gemmatales bacterium]